MGEFGEMTLNRNPKNYFSEVEQVAFNPAHMVPGIEPSADPVLQSRLYSYPDTHRHRVGVNYQQLPVNAPRVNYRMGNLQRDGAMAFLNQGSRPNYISSIAPISFKERQVNLDKTHAHFASNAVTFLREVREDLASRLEKATGIKGYPGIADLKFNGTHNGMARKEENRVANGMGAKGVQLSRGEANGAPVKGTHASKVVSTGGLKGSINGVH